MAEQSKASSRHQSFFRKKWATALGLMAIVVLVIDFFTKSIGVVTTVTTWVGPRPLVHISSVDTEGGGTCLRFGFDKLPENFDLGTIRFDIVEVKGPYPIAGDQAAEIFEQGVTMELSPIDLLDRSNEIACQASIAAAKEGDAAYFEFCPTLAKPGERLELRVIPSLFTPAGKKISDIEISYHDDSADTDGVKVVLSRPKNMEVDDENLCAFMKKGQQ